MLQYSIIIISKNIDMWAKIFFNLAAECSLILDYSIHESFCDVNNINFISNVIGKRVRSLSFVMDWYVLN